MATLKCTTLQSLALNPTVKFETAQLAEEQFTQPTYALLSVLGDSPTDTNASHSDRQALYLYELGLKLAKHGCQVDLFTRRSAPDLPDVVEHCPGFRTIYLTAGPARSISRHQGFEYLPAFVDAWFAFQHRGDRQYKLCHSYDWLSGWVGLQLKQKLGLPLIYTNYAIGILQHQHYWLETHKMMSLRYSVEQTCLEQADCVVVASPTQVADLRQSFSIAGQIKVIPWGVDVQHFGSLSQASARQQLGISPETRLILYVGGFATPLKQLETLLAACALLPKPFQLYLMGDNSEGTLEIETQQHLKTLASQMNIEDCLVVIERVSRSHLPAYYAAANVCVVPSCNETSGAVALESMAAGTPVIATATNGLQYSVRHGQTGLLIPSFDPNTVATALWDGLANPNRWYAYGMAGRHWVRTKFNYATIAAQTQKLYRSLFLESLGKALRD
jgi:D-inositol-3-phosphate glycosyltransferase